MRGETTDGRESHIFRLFACCVPVRGARRSLICDLQRQTYRFIPNGLYEILTEYRDKTLPEIKAACGHEFNEVIDEYFAFLLEHEFGFWCDDPQSFPDLDLSWRRPERISNALIDIDSESDHNYARLFHELDDLGCKALELRFFRSASIAELRGVLDGTRGGRLRSIDLLIGWSDELTPEALQKLSSDHPRIDSVVVHSTPKVLTLNLDSGTVIRYRCEAIDSPSCCGQVHAGYFVTNIDTFIESQHFNTCLNRKISIDARGEIRNCPSLVRSFGNTRQVSLHSVLAQRDFSHLWEINKDQIEICKDCEFRYICTDCRAYLSDPENVYSKPAKCTYDPYTAIWGRTACSPRDS